ncbi:TIGR03503 family protein [Vibrio ponticus]|uniref:TIGR03503 family protein n=1 Tax=Vibrio ponticus TaxID=265668 RepID=A0ABX3FGW7_9VIBR|nr:TIGR03503 family protein [Vibrio ponticus]OLQ92375.1 TIGR03503 family protein [Vibrio ponticus]
MLRIGLALIGLLVSTFCFAAGQTSVPESSMSLLDNRFRVDPTIKQITFVIYRAEGSNAVVLVRPDGRKYYSHRHPDNVRWYQESAMDIISIDNPMPGPWQAVGKVTPKNKIKLISHLELASEVLPERLYQGEELKFTARLTSDDKPLLLRDFLDRVNLKVTFTKYVENESALIKEARPVPIEIGEFADDGAGLDEHAGDGVFTVKLPISAPPGKYRVRITSGNGVFLRAQEQEVLVYPNPIELTFIQSRQVGQQHQVIFTGEQGMIKPGSLAAHIEHTNADGGTVSVEGSAASDEDMSVTLEIPYSDKVGEYSWHGIAYATELGTNRELMLPVTAQTYSVVKDIDLAETRRLQELERIQQAKLLEEQRIKEAREAQRKRSIMIIAISNVVLVVVGLVGWFVMRKIKAKRAAIPEMQLEMPKK